VAADTHFDLGWSGLGVSNDVRRRGDMGEAGEHENCVDFFHGGWLG
jgi:hypothetical protein